MANQPLSNLMLKLSNILKAARHSTSTDTGSTTTLIDSRMIGEPDDFFKGGTIWFKTGDLARYEYHTAVITAFDGTTGTFTFPVQTDVAASGIAYSAAGPMYTREDMVTAINQALISIGPLPMIYEDATLITIADQEKYTLDFGVCNIKKVFIASNLTAPYGWGENIGWHETNGFLYFDTEIPATADYLIRLYHEAPHTEVVNDADEILNTLHPDLVTWTAANYAVLSRAGVAENSEPFTKEMISYTQQQKSIAAMKHRPDHWQKRSRTSGW